MKVKRVRSQVSIVTLAGVRGGAFEDRVEFYNKIIATPEYKHFLIDEKTIHAYLVDRPGEVIVSEITLWEFNHANRSEQNELLLRGWTYLNSGSRGRRTYADEPIYMREVLRAALICMENKANEDYIASKTPEGIKS